MKSKNVCKDLTFDDCELSILRMAVDKAEEKIAKRVVNSEDIKNIIKIVEDFIRRKNLIRKSKNLLTFCFFLDN